MIVFAKDTNCSDFFVGPRHLRSIGGSVHGHEGPHQASHQKTLPVRRLRSQGGPQGRLRLVFKSCFAIVTYCRNKVTLIVDVINKRYYALIMYSNWMFYVTRLVL